MNKSRKMRRGSRRLRKMRGRGMFNKVRNLASTAKNYGSRGLATAKNYGSRGLATAKNYGSRGLATAKNYGSRGLSTAKNYRNRAKTYITGGPSNGSNQMRRNNQANQMANLKQGQAPMATYNKPSFGRKVMNTVTMLGSNLNPFTFY